MLIGYARTSTVEQVAGLEAQEASLAATKHQNLRQQTGFFIQAARRPSRFAGLRARTLQSQTSTGPFPLSLRIIQRTAWKPTIGGYPCRCCLR